MTVTMPQDQVDMQLPTRKSKSMDYGVVRHIDLRKQMDQVKELILATNYFDASMVSREIDWFYGPLGVHDFYFSGQSARNIAQHLQSLIAAKLLAQASGKMMDVQLEQESEHAAFFASRSNVQGDRSTELRRVWSPRNKNSALTNGNCTDTENLERHIEKQYLSKSAWIGDGVKAGYEALERLETGNGRTYRLQCYRSTGVLDPNLVPYHIRMYFLHAPDFVEPNPREGETDINKLGDRTFLERAGENLKLVYQECLIRAMNQMTPAFHTEIWRDEDSYKMARFTVAYKVGATHSYFSSIADVYRQHGFFTTRKYVEFFSNGYVIYGFYLQMLTKETPGERTFEERLDAMVADCSLHFVLPRTSLTPMLTNGLLNPQQISYAYAAWKFTFHFMHRLPEAYTVVADSLRDRDPGAFARLEKLRYTMKVNTYMESQILDHILANPEVIKVLYEEFEVLHSPNCVAEKATWKPEETLSKLRKSIVAEQALMIFFFFHTFNMHIQKTNFFRDTKSSLVFRLDGEYLSKTEFPDKPYAIIYVIGSEFRGFHVRFLDIARGGIRMIRSSHAQVYLNNVSSLFDECYSLASTQQRKNKDIPEGGSKGVILLNQAHQDKADIAFKKYIDALLDVMLFNKDCKENKSDEEELLFLGPDEGTAHLMDWASLYANKRGYSYWKAFTTGKSASYGGIPHDVYGMTTHSVREYVKGIQRKLKLGQNGQKITKMQTGGPDGDLGSNEIKMSPQESTIAVVDGSGVLFDPEGINREELLRLASLRKPISDFDSHKLSAQGYQVLVTQNDITLPNGEVVENGTEFRNMFHLRQTLTADFFVPCGGRPSAVNLSNIDDFMYQPDKKTLRFKYIVEGANLFFTQDARLRLEKAGVILFKDCSANKGGVTSSSLEVLAAMAMTDEEFAEHMQVDATTGKKPAFYEDYVKEVQRRIDLNALREFECIWREHERTGIPLSVLSNRLSERITGLSVKIQTSQLWNNKTLRERILNEGFPEILLTKIGRSELLARLPESYVRALFASQLASRFVYSCGLNAPEFGFYEFVQSLTLEE